MAPFGCREQAPLGPQSWSLTQGVSEPCCSSKKGKTLDTLCSITAGTISTGREDTDLDRETVAVQETVSILGGRLGLVFDCNGDEDTVA